jgi:hypothetical protein
LAIESLDSLRCTIMMSKHIFCAEARVAEAGPQQRVGTLDTTRRMSTWPNRRIWSVCSRRFRQICIGPPSRRLVRSIRHIAEQLVDLLLLLRRQVLRELDLHLDLELAGLGGHAVDRHTLAENHLGGVRTCDALFFDLDVTSCSDKVPVRYKICVG